ncbi:MAG TPA: DUF2911 domain-containing protein [Gemmatimonadaceae bacterium]|nr:DUF2911 domain-containing protein [Gemmatimonadaceae bacterium]
MTTPMRSRLVCCFVLALAAAAAGSARAQEIPKSQLGTVTQMVGAARIEIVYRRPVARGRQLFGALVPWGRVWTPSADSAAVLTVSAPIIVNGGALPAGSYSVWAVPGEREWTVIFNAVAHTFHLRYPEGREVLRVRATPRSGEPVETLAFDFPVVDADSATLVLRWGTTVVPMTIRAQAR